MAVYGPHKVTEMESAIGQAMQNHHPDMQLLAHNMQASDDPVGVAMHWFNLNRVVTETGGDLNAYLEKMADDPAYQAKVMERARAKAQGIPAATGTRPAINLPPSLSSAPNTGMPNAVAGEADMSDKALFAHAMAPEPRRR